MTEIDGLLMAMQLKDEKRTGWELRHIDDPESVADHTWGVSFLTLLYGPNENIDVSHALKLATIHDLAEAQTGDVPTRADDAATNASQADKPSREREAIQDLTEHLGGQDIAAYWEEYESRTTPEAVFVKDMDCIDLVLQALFYEKHSRYDPTDDNPHFQTYDNLDEFFATTDSLIRTATGKQLFESIHERYEAAKHQ